MEPQDEYQEIVGDPDMTEQQSEEKQDASTKEESNQ